MLPHEPFLREQRLIRLFFDDPFSGGEIESDRHTYVLWTLTGHRPRWLVELCKEAARLFAGPVSKTYRWDNIDSQLDIGRKRIEDTVAEFKSQCARIEDFYGRFRDSLISTQKSSF